MAERYLTRLRELIQEARHIAQTKLRLRELDAVPTENGLPGRIAYRLQGLASQDVNKIVQENSTDVDWSSAWGQSGKFVEYGIAIAPDLSAWIATKFSDFQLSVNVFEAEIGLLATDVGEGILKIRAQMKSLHNRADLCFKILCALEKKGKKVTADRLDKMKLSFQKMEEKASKQLEKMKAAEAKQRERKEAAEAKQREKKEAAEAKQREKMKAAEARAELAEKKRLESERKRKEKESLKVAKESSAKKKEREKKAQADLMSRFLNKRVTPRKPSSPPVARVISLDSPVRPVPIPDIPSDVEVVENAFHLELCKDKSVLPASSWLHALIDYDIASKNLDFLHTQADGINLEATKSHLTSCELRRLRAEKKIGPVLCRYRNERAVGRENKCPRFASRRSDLRGRGRAGPMKVFKHDKDYRPTFFGTVVRRSAVISGRKPFAKDNELDYEVDSDLEWEPEAEDGESLSDIEDDKELARENAELRELYGSDDESDDSDFLDDAEADDDEGDESDTNDAVEFVGESGSDGTKDVVINVDALPPTSKKRRAEELKGASEELRKKKRRKARSARQGRVEIIGLDFGDGDVKGSSPLDCYRVTKHTDAAAFVPYDPEVEQRMLQQSNSTNKVQLGEAGAHQLATMLHFAKTIPKTKTVSLFLKLREMRKESIPTQAEVGRHMALLAIREKREQDTKPCWYLKDVALAQRIDTELLSNVTLRNQILQVQHLARTALATTSAGTPGQPPGTSNGTKPVPAPSPKATPNIAFKPGVSSTRSFTPPIAFKPVASSTGVVTAKATPKPVSAPSNPVAIPRGSANAATVVPGVTSAPSAAQVK